MCCPLNGESHSRQKWTWTCFLTLALCFTYWKDAEYPRLTMIRGWAIDGNCILQLCMGCEWTQFCNIKTAGSRFFFCIPVLQFFGLRSGARDWNRCCFIWNILLSFFCWGVFLTITSCYHITWILRTFESFELVILWSLEWKNHGTILYHGKSWNMVSSPSLENSMYRGQWNLILISSPRITGWWFGTCFIFHNIWENPSQLTNICSEGMKPPTGYWRLPSGKLYNITMENHHF